MLIEAGADKDARNHCGSTALMFAARKGWVEVVRLLVEAGACKGLANLGDDMIPKIGVIYPDYYNSY